MSTLKNKSKSELIEEIESLKNQVRNLERIEEERIRKANELKTSKEKLRAIFDSAADGMVETDLSGNILKVNKAILRIFGSTTEEDFTGKSALEFYAADDRDRAMKAYRQAFFESIAEESEFMALKVDGTPFPVQITSAVLCDANEKQIGFVGIIKDITERKHSENELQKSEKQYRSVVENAGELIWQVDCEGKFIFFNNFAEKVSGQKSAAWEGKHFAPLVHPDDLTRVNKIFEDTLAGKTIEYETRIFNKDGEIINLEIQTMPVYVEGEVTGTLNFGRDITIRKKVEAKLQESELRFRKIFEEGLVGIVIAGPDYQIINANPLFCKMFGYSEQELRSLSFKDITHPDFIESSLEDAKNLFEGKPSKKREKIYLKKNKEQLWGEVAVTAIRDEKGNFLYYLAMVEDISEKKKAQLSLEESEGKFRRLAENAPDIIYRFRISPDPAFEFISPAVTEIAGYTPQEYYDDPNLGSKIIHPDDQIKLDGFYEGIIPEGPHQVRWIRKDGKIIWTEDRATPIYNEKGEFIAIEGIAREVTAQKEAEEALREAYDIINKSPAVPFLWKNEEGWPVEYVSENVADLFEYSAEEFMSGKVRYSELIHPEDINRIENEVIKFSSEKDRDRFSHEPYRIVTKSGRIKWVEDKTYIRRDENNNITHYQGIVEDITPRRLAELDRLESEEKFSKTFNSSPSPMIISEIESGKVVDINKSFAKLIMYSKQEVLGKSVFDLNLWANIEDRGNYIKKMTEDKRVSNLEIKIRTKSEEIRDSLISGEIITIQGKPYLLTSGIDITERKLADEALRESEQKFREMSDLLPQIVYETDLNANLTFSNKHANLIFGYSEDELNNNFNLLNNVIPEDRDRAEENMKNIMTGKPVENSEYSLIKKDGSIFPVLIYSSPVIKGNKPVGLRGIVVDISERKRAEELIQESERRLATLMSNLPGMAYKCKNDPDWKMEFISDGGYSLTGYYSEELVDNYKVSYADLIHPQDRQMVWDKVQDAIEMKQPFQLNYRITTASGAEKWVWEQGQAIYGDENDVLSLEGFITDITELKKADKKLRDSHNQLRSLAERLQMIREEERATVAREIHDDLGQTLTALKMDIAWMKKNSGMTDEMRTSKLDGILGLTDSTIQTVKRIATDLRPGILDDLGLVSAIEWQTKEFQNRSGIECKFEIYVDEFAIEEEISVAVFRIFQESLTNIARHSQATKVTITIMRTDDFFLLEISDNGVGINEEQINSSKSLGLIGMNERVSVFRGKLTISRVAEGGTAVRVYIPMGET